MEKRTILAIVLSVVTITGFYLIQYTFFPPKTAGVQQQQVTAEQDGGPAPIPVDEVLPAGAPDAEAPLAAAAAAPDGVETFPEYEQITKIETPLFIVELSNSGGDITSFKLKEHRDGDDYVDMILSGDKPAHAFTLAFGNKSAAPLNAFFNSKRISDTVIEYYRDFLISGSVFHLTKRYTFLPDEYMFQLEITLDGGLSVPALSFASGGEAPAAYTLAFGPQLGPRFDKLDGNYDYRRYITFVNGKQRQEKVAANQDAIVSSHISWASIAGKYFAFIMVPDATAYELVFSARPPEQGIQSASRLYIVRPPLSASRSTDVFRFYLGPKTSKTLTAYDTGVNSFKYTDLRLEQVANAGGFWGILAPLEALLNWLLNLFHELIPNHNYGVAIILVTLLVKILLFPLTKKSSEGTLRMQAMAPKIKEIQAKYKDNPQKMNLELAGLYKKEGYSPLSGCLPMLIQLPIFLAMYNLFNNHFELRGAMFIPGWIPDLSVPETVWNFAPFRVPILGWSDLRLLPFFYVGSQLLYGKVTQTPDQAGNTQMKIMLYAMPIMFFFILYNVPSGLLVYWIMSNILTMVQQLAINRLMAGRKAALAASSSPEKKIIVPPKKRKKR